MATQTAVGDAQANRPECWCCGAVADPDQMVHLGKHPEVALCLRCARWAARQAAAIEDRRKTGPMVLGRNVLSAARRTVVSRGRHLERLVRGAMSWLRQRLP